MGAMGSMRLACVCTLRAIGIGCLALALFAAGDVALSIHGAISQVGFGNTSWLEALFNHSGSPAARFASWFILGIALCLLSGRLTLWLVPDVSRVCLKCGHKMDPANAGVCPECGTS